MFEYNFSALEKEVKISTFHLLKVRTHNMKVPACLPFRHFLKQFSFTQEVTQPGLLHKAGTTTNRNHGTQRLVHSGLENLHGGISQTLCETCSTDGLSSQYFFFFLISISTTLICVPKETRYLQSN